MNHEPSSVFYRLYSLDGNLRVKFISKLHVAAMMTWDDVLLR